MENTQQFTSSYNMFTSLISIPHSTIHATHSKLTIGFSQPDLKYVKCTTTVTTADASSPMDSNLKCLLSLHVNFHQKSHSLFRKLVSAFLDPSRQTIQLPSKTAWTEFFLHDDSRSSSGNVPRPIIRRNSKSPPPLLCKKGHPFRNPL